MSCYGYSPKSGRACLNLSHGFPLFLFFLSWESTSLLALWPLISLILLKLMFLTNDFLLSTNFMFFLSFIFTTYFFSHSSEFWVQCNLVCELDQSMIMLLTSFLLKQLLHFPYFSNITIINILYQNKECVYNITRSFHLYHHIQWW